MHWKVKLDGEENTMSQLAGSNTTPVAHISRDGIDWFLESTDFEMMMDHQEVKGRAAEIIGTLVGADSVIIGPIYRIHYDNSKTVFRD